MKYNKNTTDNKVNNLFEFGLKCIDNGLQPILVKLTPGKAKKPLYKWQDLTKRLQAAGEFKNRFTGALDKTNKIGIALICGKVSGNLEVIDIDNKNGNAEDIFNDWNDIKDVKEILTKYTLPIEKTLSGGVHIWYKCDKIEGNLKLARQNKNTVAETRGEGGYCLCDPSNGYELLNGDLLDIPRITTDERETLLTCLRSFTDFYDFRPYKNNKIQNADGLRPGDIFNTLPTTQNEIKNLLTSSDYTYSHSDPKGDFYTRPGKDKGVSCCYNGQTLYNWSSNDPYLPQNEKAYNSFQIFTFIKYNGDFTAAAKELANRPEIRERLGISKPKNEKTTICIYQDSYKRIIQSNYTENEKNIIWHFVQFAEHEKNYKGDLCLERGELITGRGDLAKKLGINSSTIKNILGKLRDNKIIEMREVKKGKIYIYKLLTYDDYVPKGQP